MKFHIIHAVLCIYDWILFSCQNKDIMLDEIVNMKEGKKERNTGLGVIFLNVSAGERRIANNPSLSLDACHTQRVARSTNSRATSFRIKSNFPFSSSILSYILTNTMQCVRYRWDFILREPLVTPFVSVTPYSYITLVDASYVSKQSPYSLVQLSRFSSANPLI